MADSAKVYTRAQYDELYDRCCASNRRIAALEAENADLRRIIERGSSSNATELGLSAQLEEQRAGNLKLLERTEKAESEKRAAVLAEREACAKECEDQVGYYHGEVEAIPVYEIEQEIAHIKENGSKVGEICGYEDEGRCRELCAMYLREFIISWRMGEQLKLLRMNGGTGK